MKKYIYLVLVLFASLAGCKKSYLDINTNPNSPTEGSIPPDLILPRALHATASQVGAGYANVARWMGYWARGGDYGPSAEEESYNITTGYGLGVWGFWYDNLNDYDVMERKANASGQKLYEGIAKTMKTIGFMNLVDMFNNVPYSKAFDLGANITPAYDKGEDIYKDLFVQLDKAAALVDAAGPGEDLKIETADIMFQGNKTKWKKFINTQRLKLVVRLSQVSVIPHTAELAKTSSEGFLMSGETASVQPGYAKAFSGSGATQQNPFWDTYEQDVAGVFNDRYNRANNYVLDTFRRYNDIRYQYFFDAAQTPLAGNTYWGYNYGFVDPDPNNPKSINSSGVGGPGLARSAGQAQWLFTSVESLFLQAEAIQRGWIPGNARAAYEAAVTESFIWLGVTNAVPTANAYLTSGDEISSWDLANTDALKIRLIIRQKYYALIGLNNFEAWVDYRRTGYPNVPRTLAPNAGPNIPLRYLYPRSEFDYNPRNVAAEGPISPFTSAIFWDR